MMKIHLRMKNVTSLFFIHVIVNFQVYYTTANFLFIPSCRVVATLLEQWEEKIRRRHAIHLLVFILVLECNDIHALVFVETGTFRTLDAIVETGMFTCWLSNLKRLVAVKTMMFYNQNYDVLLSKLLPFAAVLLSKLVMFCCCCAVKTRDVFLLFYCQN